MKHAVPVTGIISIKIDDDSPNEWKHFRVISIKIVMVNG
jgi:hypothetical protein